jgi:parvulin-like peptidyl-prolyl isomerase
MPPAVVAVRCLALLAVALLAAAAVEDAAATARDGQLIDRALRYVNGAVLSFGDLVERMQSQRGRAAPASREEELGLWRTALDDATTDLLLAQFADEREVQIDRERVSLNVIEQARRSGRGLSLADQAAARRRQERREKISAALYFFDARSSNVQPSELLAAYESRKVQFRRPARAHVLQIALRPTDEAERAAFVEAQEQVFRRAQGAGEAAVAVVEPFLARLVELADSPERPGVLDDAIAAVAALPEAGADRRLRDLIGDAKRLVARRAAMRTREETEAEVEALRASLVGEDAEAFRAAAKEISQGARREDGGDLGWVEAGYLAKAMDAQAFAVGAGELSPVFWSDQLCCLLRVERSEPATQRSFAEVSGELESLLRQERQAEVRVRAAAILRERSVVRDLVVLDDLIR